MLLIDTLSRAQLELQLVSPAVPLLAHLPVSQVRKLTVSWVKIIVITVALILSILLFGRFLF
jgi:hypothetical protein